MTAIISFYPLHSCGRYVPREPSNWWSGSRPCGERARWEMRGTTVGGDVDGRDYHWTSYLCDAHLQLRQHELRSATYLRECMRDLVVTAIPVPADRWALLLMLRAWTDEHVPDSVKDRLSEAEDHAARRGHIGERYAWAVFEQWWNQTPVYEERYVLSAWQAVGQVLAGEHGSAWTLTHLRYGRACS